MHQDSAIIPSFPEHHQATKCTGSCLSLQREAKHSSAVISENIHHKTCNSEWKKILVITTLPLFKYYLPSSTQEKQTTRDQASLLSAPFSTIPLTCSTQAGFSPILQWSPSHKLQPQRLPVKSGSSEVKHYHLPAYLQHPFVRAYTRGIPKHIRLIISDYCC